MPSLAENISTAFTAIGGDVGHISDLLNGGASDLSALSTTEKSSLLLAINELVATVAGTINDASTSASSTWSSNKIDTELSAAIAALVGSAPGTLDTLEELSSALNDTPGVINNILSAQGKRVAVDAAQVFTAPEQLQGCNNLNIGDPTTDFTSIYTAARDS